MKLADVGKTPLTPRVSTVLAAMFLKISGSACATVALATENPVLGVCSALACVVWFLLLFLASAPSTDRFLLAQRACLERAAKISILMLIGIGVLEAALVVAVVLGGLRGIGGELGTLLNSYRRIGEYGDATALQHQATNNFLAGRNPYEEANIITAGMQFEVPSSKLTPLRTGRFAADFPYPGFDEIESVYLEAQATPDEKPKEFVTAYSYPAGSFILPAPFIALGVPDLRMVFVLFLLSALAYVVWRTRSRNLRIYFAAAILASLEVWHSIFSGGTNLLVFPLILMAWILYRRNLWLSALFMGIAIATKQMAWFLLPFYLILIFREKGFRAAILTGAINGGIFLLFNGFYIAADPHLWLSSMIAPMMNDLFPSNVLVITLDYLRLVHAHSSWPFTAIEIVSFLLALGWYFVYCRRFPDAALVLAIVPFLFAWRGSWGYMYYFDLVILAWLVTSQRESRSLQTVPLVRMTEAR